MSHFGDISFFRIPIQNTCYNHRGIDFPEYRSEHRVYIYMYPFEGHIPLGDMPHLRILALLTPMHALEKYMYFELSWAFNNLLLWHIECYTKCVLSFVNNETKFAECIHFVLSLIKHKKRLRTLCERALIFVPVVKTLSSAFSIGLLSISTAAHWPYMPV